MKLGQLVRLVDGDYRSARYLLERGLADRWVRRWPGSGHHRDLKSGEAFALALLLRLRGFGFAAPQVERIVELVEQLIQRYAQKRKWDPRFAPFLGRLTADRQWFAEIGDHDGFRLVTDANPSHRGRLEATDWVSLDKRRRPRVLKGFQPVLILRMHLTQLANVIASVGENLSPGPA